MIAPSSDRFEMMSRDDDNRKRPVSRDGTGISLVKVEK